ncbi:tail fiber protein [Salmonella enterica]|nr:tail fiber protein [Salmonella enterica]ELB8084899.1 tail fiber protein [Salmonella enterica]ELJ1892612.1 tail fiber protein [Salmonella enterica]
MGKLTELEQWEEDVYQIETSDPVLGGPDGVSNRPQKQLANRTRWLKKQLKEANNALTEHEKSRNHPDATLTDKGFVRLYSGVTSLDETMAATPKAVKIAMDNANERLAKARNLADLQNVPAALLNLTMDKVKKYVESTNTGLEKLPRFSLAGGAELDALPAGYLGIVRNQNPGGPLPDEDEYYLHVTGKLYTDGAIPEDGCAVRLVSASTPQKIWTGVRYNDGGADVFRYIWSQEYNTLNPPPRQLLPDSLIRGNNLSDLTSPAEGVKNLLLTETVNRAANAVQKTGDTLTGNLFLRNDGRMHFSILNADGSVRMWLYKDKGGDGIRINNGADGGGDFVLGKNSTFYSPGDVRAGGARLAVNGDIGGAVWGGLLSSWLNNQFAARDKDINARATIAWVNQYFATKSTASIGMSGWFRDASTGLIFQWGETGRTGYSTWVNFPIAFTAFCSAVFLTQSDAITNLNNSTQNIHASGKGSSGFNYLANSAEVSAFWLAVGR